MNKKIFLSLVYFFGVMLRVLAQDAGDVPARPTPPRLVNDLAGLLSPEERETLERKLVAYNDSTSTQITIVNIASIEPYDISAYAYRLAETWGIGQKGKNNGILILTAVKERKVNISTGYGMEAILPDALAQQITEYTLKPNYKEGNYYKGLDEAINFISKVASGQYKAPPRAQNTSSSDSPGMFWIIIGVLALIIIINLIKRGGGGGRGGRGMRTLGGPFFPPVIFGDFSSGRGPFGGGGFGGGGGGGGGFGGFGGGSFGGGGASSDW